MPLPQNNHHPPFNIVRVSHVEWVVTNMAYARNFYIDTLGYYCQEDADHTLYLRGMEERNHHSLILTQGDKPVVKRIGFKVGSDEELDKAAVYFNKIGQSTEWVTKHAQGRTLHTTDPFGVPLEFYFEMERGENLLQKYQLYRGARIQRIDHVQDHFLYHTGTLLTHGSGGGQQCQESESIAVLIEVLLQGLQRIGK